MGHKKSQFLFSFSKLEYDSLKEYKSREICSNHFTNLIEQEGVIAVKFEKFVTDNTR